MKYLISFVVLFALIGCDNQPAGPQESATAAAGKTDSYLDKPVRGMVNQRGLYKLLRSSGVVDDPRTTAGKAVVSPVIQLVKSTERIPLIKGAQMYLQYRLWYLPDQPVLVDLRRVLKHPAMTLPDGSITTGSDFAMKGKVSVNQVIAYTGYGLDRDYELVEGDWIFEIWHQDKKLLEQKFTTYWPDEEEIEELKQILAPQKSLVKMASPDDKGDPRLNWPRVTIDIGDDPAPEPAGSSN